MSTTQSEAYALGQQAAERGFTKALNPYPFEQPSALHAWNAGWDSVQMVDDFTRARARRTAQNALDATLFDVADKLDSLLTSLRADFDVDDDERLTKATRMRIKEAEQAHATLIDKAASYLDAINRK